MASIMWNYIREEREVIKKLLQSNQADIISGKLASRIKAIYFVSHGSSFNAAVSVLSYFINFSGVRAYAYTPENLLISGKSLLLENKEEALVVGISQTGTSMGALIALEQAHKLGFPTLAVTETIPSPIQQAADYVLDIMCGPEVSNAKTKGYTATLVELVLFSLSLGKVKGLLKEDEYKVITSELNDMADLLPSNLDKIVDFCRKNKFGKDLKDLYVVASGIHLGSAQEGQLKLMETMCIPTMFNDSGEFSHGMHRAINKNSTILFIRCSDERSTQIRNFWQYFSELGAQVWMLDCSEKPESGVRVLDIPKFEKTRSLLLVVQAIQIFSVFTPELNGLDPNRDANNSFTVVAETRVKQ